MKFSIASDHAACDLKNHLIEFLTHQGYKVHDCTPDVNPADSYSEAADRVCANVLSKECDKGILLCGTGQGTAIRANRHFGIRAALVTNDYMAEMARSHNDANVLVLGARLTTATLATRMLELFIKTPFEAGRHTPRIERLEQLL